MSQRHSILALLDPGPTAAERAILLLRRRNFRVRNLRLNPSRGGALSRLQVEVEGGASTVALVCANLEKLISVRRVAVLPPEGAAGHDLALVQLRTSSSDPRLGDFLSSPELLVLGRDAAGTLIEITGPAPRVDAWLERLRPLGIADHIRTQEVRRPAAGGLPSHPSDPSFEKEENHG